MKNLKFIAITIVAVLFFYAPSVFAVLRVKFPSNSDMQPPPLNVKPNVSRNINYEGDRVIQTNNNQDKNLPIQQNASSTQKESNNDFPLALGFLSAGLLVVALLAKEKKV